MGVRFLDLRIQKTRNNIYFCSHNFTTIPLSHVITDIDKFLKEYPSEYLHMILRADHRIEKFTSNIYVHEQEIEEVVIPAIER
jgi:hypothetical protein